MWLGIFRTIGEGVTIMSVLGMDVVDCGARHVIQRSC